MPAARKKVILRQWTGEWTAGYLEPAAFLQAGSLELLDLSGKVQTFPAAAIKWICFVRDFNSGEIDNPERLLRKTFGGRPRANGLWVRALLLDEDTLEGLATNDASLVSSQGLFLVPPDTRSNTQRLFLPGTSIAHLEVLSVIGAPAVRPRRTPPQADQPGLFPKP